jgi:hypothetical protein
MLRRCAASPYTGTGCVKGWRLTFGAEEYGWEGALATLVPDDTTPGRVAVPWRLRRPLQPHRGRREDARRLGGATRGCTGSCPTGAHADR